MQDLIKIATRKWRSQADTADFYLCSETGKQYENSPYASMEEAELFDPMTRPATDYTYEIDFQVTGIPGHVKAAILGKLIGYIDSMFIVAEQNIKFLGYQNVKRPFGNDTYRVKVSEPLMTHEIEEFAEDICRSFDAIEHGISLELVAQTIEC